MFGETKLNELLVEKSGLKTSVIQTELINMLKQHRKNYLQNDDITFVLVKKSIS
jgi:serine phosphatase RsbU (regulator of sigma subunit)